MEGIIFSLVIILAGVLATLLFVLRGKTVTPDKITLGFMEVKISDFEGLSPIKMFRALTMKMIPESEDHKDALTTKEFSTKSPLVLVHIGWNMVCEAFIERFDTYPSDEAINAAASDIGGENAEFVTLYRRIHLEAAKNEPALSRSIAEHYLVRAPSLAERISGRAATRYQDEFGAKFFAAAASSIIHNPSDGTV